MFKKILLGLGILLLVIMVAALFQPNTFKVERSTLVDAAPAKVYPLVADFKAWKAWSPWEKMEPEMKQTFEGSMGKEGSSSAWDGDKVGSGKMTLLKAQPNSALDIKLEFYKPMQGLNDIYFGFQPEGKSTKVTWTMTGPMNYISKIICLFVSMDKMIGKDFEKGLADLKATAEAKK